MALLFGFQCSFAPVANKNTEKKIPLFKNIICILPAVFYSIRVWWILSKCEEPFVFNCTFLKINLVLNCTSYFGDNGRRVSLLGMTLINFGFDCSSCKVICSERCNPLSQWYYLKRQLWPSLLATSSKGEWLSRCIRTLRGLKKDELAVKSTGCFCWSPEFNSQ